MFTPLQIQIDRECAAIGSLITEGVDKIPLQGNRQIMEARQLLREAQRKLRQLHDSLAES